MPPPKLLAFAFIALFAACDREPPELRPPGGPEDFLRAADILVAAQCELDSTASRADPRFSAKKAEITLSLLVRVSESTGGGVTLTVPIASSDLTLRRDRVPAGEALRRMDFRLTHTFGTTPVCPSAKAPVTKTGLRYVEGGLGLAEWVKETDRLVVQAGRAPRELNYSMSFEVTLSDDRSPVISSTEETVDSDFTRQDATARELRHRIVVTMVPGTPSDRALHDAANRFLDRIGG